ncbi:MAG: hypothetical protein NC191_03790 [Muribaculaceae bacterium]|nr:hypothetical protein [Muribaculaceae bacterium]
MAFEDNFLRLDPYNFDTEEEFNEFYNDERIEDERTYSNRTNKNRTNQ